MNYVEYENWYEWRNLLILELSYTYYITSDYDRPGNDIESHTVNGSDECSTLCSSNSRCAAFKLNSLNSLNSLNCLLKSATSNCTAQSYSVGQINTIGRRIGKLRITYLLFNAASSNSFFYLWQWQKTM